MHRTQRQQTIELLRSNGIERALFAHPHSVTWLTGFAPPIQTGQNLFAGGPTMVWYEDGHFTLIVLDAQASGAVLFEQEPDGSVIRYLGYTIEQPIASSQNLTEILEKLIDQSKYQAGEVGIEARVLTALLQNAVVKVLSSDVEIRHIDDWLIPLRMVKTDEELTKLRQNFALTDVGHAAARETVRAGLREIDVWTAVHSAIQREAGCRVPLGNDCVVGYRKANIGGWPLEYEIHEHDSLIVDLSTIHEGYWSDSCATYYAGERTAKQATIHKVVRDALDYAISLARPGAVTGEIDQKVRQFIRDAGYTPYPHHTGHGVGASGHEEPRIVPYSQEVLQPGMVIMLEPGIYFPGETGVRMEDGLLITADGAEVLTQHDKS
jgi:Xaa-Pro dipeptidase